MDILHKTLEQMPFTFTSNEFSKKARKNGLSDRMVAAGRVGDFLHLNAVQGETRRTWQKSIMQQKEGPKNGQIDYGDHTVYYPIASNGVEKSEEDKLKEAIAFVKSKGLRVMKPVSEWIEL